MEDDVIMAEYKNEYYTLEDIVFEQRNKAYGAYDLRQKYRKYILLAFLISFTIIGTAVVTPLIQAYYNKHKKVNFVEKNVIAVMENMNNEEEAPPPPPPPPPPPAAIVEQVKFTAPVVVDSVKEEEVTIQTADEQVQTAVVEAPPEELVVEEKKEEVIQEEEPAFIIVEEQATFKGGTVEDFRKWIAENLQYPQQAAENGSQGRVIIQFAINSRGEACDVKVLRSAGDPLLDAEAIRVIKSSPKWTAARQGGAPVKQQFTLPINFTLQQ